MPDCDEFDDATLDPEDLSNYDPTDVQNVFS